MDQVDLLLSSILGDFLQFVGGPDQASSMIPLFEKLTKSEDVVVRGTAATSTVAMLTNLTPKNNVIPYFEMYQRLCVEDGELFYGRMSACQIAAQLYRLLPPAEKTAIIESFKLLATDELSMVRRGAASNIVKLAKECAAGPVVSEIVELMKIMLTDENLAVRVIAFESLGLLSLEMKRLSVSTPLMSDFAKLIHAASDDPSWKIREVVAKNFGIYATSFPASAVASDIFPALIAAQQDGEEDVRIMSLEGTVPFVAALGASPFLSEFAPMMIHLVDDSSSGVRKALSDACVDIAAAIKDVEKSQILYDIILRLAQDEDPLVRLRVVKKLPIIAAETPTLCLKLTVILKRTFQDSNWRVRKHLGQAMPSVVKHCGADYFTEHFLKDFLSLLQDPVDEVRSDCSKIVPSFVAAAGAGWVFERIFPTVKSLLSEGFMVRLGMLSVLHGLLLLEIPESQVAIIIDLFGTASKDKVPNIRLRVAKLLGEVARSNRMTDIMRVAVRPILTFLTQEKDKDVKYFATESLKICR